MKSKIIISIMTLLVCVTSLVTHAETVTRKEAASVAKKFFDTAYGKSMANPDMVYNGRNLTTGRLFLPFYVFNSPAGGFVIVSADNKTYPILGFNLKENFNPNRIGPKEKALLSGYARDIELIRYDHRIPFEAIESWTYIDNHIRDLLANRYEATDPILSMEDATDRISNIFTSDRIEEMSSDIFSPAQWRDIIDEELSQKGSVALALISGDSTYPVILHGRQGDYYRIVLDGANNSRYRLMATEFLSAGQIADLDKPISTNLNYEEEEDEAFTLFTDFISSAKKESEEKYAVLEAITQPKEAILQNIGGGHFEIHSPENIAIAYIYNLQGAVADRLTFKESNVAAVNLDRQPPGFYVVLAIGESGTPYSFKIHK